jgi:hypothetical protein
MKFLSVATIVLSTAFLTAAGPCPGCEGTLPPQDKRDVDIKFNGPAGVPGVNTAA